MQKARILRFGTAVLLAASLVTLPLWSETEAEGSLHFTAVDMVAPTSAEPGQTHGLGVVPRLKNGDLTTPSTIVTTSDGGVTWHKRSEIDAITVYDLELVSLSRGYAIAHRGRSGNALLRTDDGGTTWRPLPSGSERGPSRVAFLDADVGWRVSIHSLEKTEDAGDTWAPVNQPCSDAWTPTGVYFVDQSTGWLLCHDGAAAGHTAKRLYGTVDGGVTWDLLAAGDVEGPGGLPFAGSVDDLTFVGDVGWLTVSDAAGTRILSTHDGGKTWGLGGFATDRQGFIGSLDFTDGKNGWVLSGDRGSADLYSTVDGGASWHSVGATLGDDQQGTPSVLFPETGAEQPAGTGANWAIPLVLAALGAALVVGLLAFRWGRSIR